MVKSGFGAQVFSLPLAEDSFSPVRHRKRSKMEKILEKEEKREEAPPQNVYVGYNGYVTNNCSVTF